MAGTVLCWSGGLVGGCRGVGLPEVACGAGVAAASVSPNLVRRILVPAGVSTTYPCVKAEGDSALVYTAIGEERER